MTILLRIDVLGVNVVAIEGHRVGIRTVVSRDQPGQCGLAGAGPANDGGQPPEAGGECELVEQCFPWCAWEAHPFTARLPPRAADSLRRTRVSWVSIRSTLPMKTISPSFSTTDPTLAALMTVPLTLCASRISVPNVVRVKTHYQRDAKTSWMRISLSVVQPMVAALTGFCSTPDLDDKMAWIIFVVRFDSFSGLVNPSYIWIWVGGVEEPTLG